MKAIKRIRRKDGVVQKYHISLRPSFKSLKPKPNFEVAKIYNQGIITGRDDFTGWFKRRTNWVVYVVDDRKEDFGMTMFLDRGEVKVKKAFSGSKKEVRDWLKKNHIVFVF